MKTRNHPTTIFLSRMLADRGVPPDFISLLGVVFAAAAAVLLALTPYSTDPQRMTLFVVAAVAIQLRMLCNVLDGMIALESERKSTIGVLWNEAPDRFQDVVIFVAAGYAFGSLDWLGWLTAILALGTSYIRSLGVVCGVGDVFSGVMSKPRRMAVMTIGCLLQPFFPTQYILTVVLGLISLGCAGTIFHRIRVIIHRMKAGLGGEL